MSQHDVDTSEVEYLMQNEVVISIDKIYDRFKSISLTMNMDDFKLNFS